VDGVVVLREVVNRLVDSLVIDLGVVVVVGSVSRLVAVSLKVRKLVDLLLSDSKGSCGGENGDEVHLKFIIRLTRCIFFQLNQHASSQ